MQRPPQGDSPAARVADVLGRASHALEREPNVMKAMLGAMASGEASAIPVKNEINTTLRAIVANAIDGPREDPVADFDDIVAVLGSVWFAELTYWTHGLNTPAAMSENLARAAALLLPTN